MLPIIEIEESAQAFIQQQGGAVTVRLSLRHGCCGGNAHIAIAETQAPKEVSALDCYTLQGVTLWIAPSLAYQGLRIRVEGWWKLRRLFVDGAPLHAGHADAQQH